MLLLVVSWCFAKCDLCDNTHVFMRLANTVNRPEAILITVRCSVALANVNKVNGARALGGGKRHTLLDP